MSPIRADGREPQTVRQPSISTQVVAHVTGSAVAEIGATSAIAAVRGPMQLTTEYRGSKGKIVCHVTIAPFASVCGGRVDPNTQRLGASEESQLALILNGICEQIVVLESFPQLYYEVSMCILTTDGTNNLNALTSALCAALVASGVEMYDMFACATVAMTTLPSSSQPQSSPDAVLVVDPTTQELERASASCTVVAGTNSKRILHLHHSGRASPVAIGRLLDAATSACLSQRSTLATSVGAAPLT